MISDVVLKKGDVIIKPLLNSFGLFFDIAGTWLIAYEVLNYYKGKRFKSLANLTPLDSPEYDENFTRWESKNDVYWALFIDSRFYFADCLQLDID